MEAGAGEVTVIGTSLHETAPSFSKGRRGRPAEDRYARRWAVYRAVAPLVDRTGVKGLSMRAAARAAGMSVGGLYRYFPAKRDLVLLPLDPGFNEWLCGTYDDRLRGTAPEEFAAGLLRTMARSVVLVRPAIRASMELGTEVFEDAVASAGRIAGGGFAEAVRCAAPELGARAAAELERGLLRTFLAAVLDRTATAEQLESDLHLLLVAHRARHRAHARPAPAVSGSAGSGGPRPA